MNQMLPNRDKSKRNCSKGKLSRSLIKNSSFINKVKEERMSRIR